MISCTRKIHFDAAHRVANHESKCKMLHGHRYVIEASFTASNLDSIGRIIDFGVIKDRLSSWIDTNWDHNTILWQQDQKLGQLIEQQLGQKIFYLPTNPTAENMAEYLLNTICKQLFPEPDLNCIRIRLYETPNCYADAVP
jgi:6-pyruvoyltetrahydropterin/6-carboxytetrahydropterin synthase